MTLKLKLIRFIPLLVACFVVLPMARATDTGSDIGNFSTADGVAVLLSNTGQGNSGFGFGALDFNTSGSFNTANGLGALANNTIGFNNTANGAYALFYNTTGALNAASGLFALYKNTSGNENTANGDAALYSNTTGYYNTANGSHAFYSNTIGNENTANGVYALYSNTSGNENSATGAGALRFNTTGLFNTASGVDALYNNTSGKYNTADGAFALFNNNTGFSNVAIGVNAGRNLTGSGNVCIGVNVYGVGGESNTTRIKNVYGSAVSGLAVYVDSGGKLGHLSSSRRYKQEIKPMDKASESILALKPVTFRYKKEIDPEKTPQFGLVAEEVGKVNPDLVTRNEEGKPETVRYDAVNAMLLNEFLKEHRKLEQQEATIAKQQKQIEALATGLQKVSDELEVSKSAPQTVLNNQ